MKGGREHRVPLCDRAVAIVEEMQTVKSGDFVFPGAKRGKPLSNMAMLTDVAPHGPRRSDGARLPRDVQDMGDGAHQYQREVVEAALAHVIGDKVEAAYQRGDLLDKRRRADGRMGRVLRQPRHERQRGCAAMTARKTTPHLKRGPKPKPKPPKRSKGRPAVPLREHPDRYTVARFDVAALG